MRNLKMSLKLDGLLRFMYCIGFIDCLDYWNRANNAKPDQALMKKIFCINGAKNAYLPDEKLSDVGDLVKEIADEKIYQILITLMQKKVTSDMLKTQINNMGLEDVSKLSKEDVVKGLGNF